MMTSAILQNQPSLSSGRTGLPSPVLAASMQETFSVIFQYFLFLTVWTMTLVLSADRFLSVAPAKALSIRLPNFVLKVPEGISFTIIIYLQRTRRCQHLSPITSLPMQSSALNVRLQLKKHTLDLEKVRFHCLQTSPHVPKSVTYS